MPKRQNDGKTRKKWKKIEVPLLCSQFGYKHTNSPLEAGYGVCRKSKGKKAFIFAV